MGWSGEKSKVEAGHWSGRREKKLPVSRSSLLRDAPLEVVPPHTCSVSPRGEGFRHAGCLSAFPVLLPGPIHMSLPLGDLGGEAASIIGGETRTEWPGGPCPQLPAAPWRLQHTWGACGPCSHFRASSQWEGDRGGQNEGLGAGAVAGIKFSTGSWKIQVGEI